MNEDDIYYVDERNAVISSSRGPTNQSGGRVIIGSRSPGSLGPRVIGQSNPYGHPGMYGAQGYMTAQPGYGQAPGYWGQQAPGYWGQQAPGYFGPGGPSMFARLSAGKIVDMAAQVFAALTSLPDAPVSTADPATDVPNLITYQSSLASYAKRDEQIRTLGSLVAKLVG
jgi:hypothetical protein